MLGTMLGPHGDFIIACYGVSVLVLALLAAWIILDGRAVRRQLAAMESRGLRRRSAGREPS